MISLTFSSNSPNTLSIHKLGSVQSNCGRNDWHLGDCAGPVQRHLHLHHRQPGVGRCRSPPRHPHDFRIKHRNFSHKHHRLHDTGAALANLLVFIAYVSKLCYHEGVQK